MLAPRFKAVRFAAFFCATLLGVLPKIEAATLYWDGDGAGTVGGGTGTWNTTLTRWSTTSNGNTYQAWTNGTNDDAYFPNSSGTVTVGAAVTAKSLTFASNNYVLTGASAITLAGGTGTIDTAGLNATINAPIAGSTGLTKASAGTLTLGGVNTYTGATNVNAGALRVVGSLGAGTAVNVASGAKLNVEGTIAGALNVAAGGILELGTNTIVLFNTAAGGFTWNGSTDGSATMLFDLDSGGVSDQLVVNGNLTKGSGSTFKIDFHNTGSAGRYTIIKTTGGTHNFAAGDITYTNLPANLSGSFDVSDPTKIDLVVGSDTAPTITISNPSVAATNTGPVTYTVTYVDDNFDSSTLSTDNITLNASGTATGTLSVSGSGASRLVTISNITGNGSLSISILAGTGVDTSGNTTPAAGPSTAVSVDNETPVITSATTASIAYQAPFSYTITANKSPVTFAAFGLPDGLTVDATTGVISGTSTTTGTYLITMRITDNASNQGSQFLHLTVISKSVTVSGLTVLNKTYDGTTTATLNTSNVVLSGIYALDTPYVSLSTSGATATFADPNVGTSKPVTVTGLALVGSMAANYTLVAPTVIGNIIGTPAGITLSNLSQKYDGLPKSVGVTTTPAGLNYTVTYNGGTAAPTNAGSYAVIATVADGSYGGQATGTLVVAKLPQTITFAALPDHLVSDGPIALSATATSGLPVTFTVSGPATVNGNTLTLTGAEGTVAVTASQAGHVNYEAAPDVVRSFNVSNRPVPGVYFGSFSGDRADAGFALLLRPDNTGVFAGYLPTVGIGVLRAFVMDQNGAFTGSFVPFGSALTVTLRGQISGSSVTGMLAPFAISFSGNFGGTAATAAVASPTIAALAREQAPGTPAVAAATAGGLYQISAVGSSGTTTITLFAGTDGRAYVFSNDGTKASGATATISSGGALNTTLADGSRVTLALAADGTADGTYTPAGGTAVHVLGGTEAATSTARMINMSARGRTSTGNAVLISGFVVSGSTPKRLVIRVAGPALTNFDVPNILPNPSLTIFNSSGTAIASNDDWGNQSPANPDLASQMLAAGAFPFGANSKDAAIVIRLAPGAYTAHALGGDGTVLTEVYELLDTGETPAQKKIINFSARGQVGVAGEPLTAGFAITGSVPKKVLIRGLGPSIASLLPGAIANPRVRVYNSAGTVLKENDDWFRDPDATQIAAAAASLNAPAFSAQGLDAALLIVLQPGSYTAIVDNVGGGTGLALVEVYEVP